MVTADFSPQQIAKNYARYPGMVSFACNFFVFITVMGGLAIFFGASSLQLEKGLLSLFLYFGGIALVLLIPTISIAGMLINRRRQIIQKKLVIYYAVKEFFMWSVVGAGILPLVITISAVIRGTVDRFLMVIVIPPLLLAFVSTIIFYLFSILLLRERSTALDPNVLYRIRGSLLILLNLFICGLILGGAYFWVM